MSTNAILASGQTLHIDGALSTVTWIADNHPACHKSRGDISFWHTCVTYGFHCSPRDSTKLDATSSQATSGYADMCAL